MTARTRTTGKSYYRRLGLFYGLFDGFIVVFVVGRTAVGFFAGALVYRGLVGNRLFDRCAYLQLG